MLTYFIIHKMISIIKQNKNNKLLITNILKLIVLSYICILTIIVDLVTIVIQILILFLLSCLFLAKYDDEYNMKKRNK